MFNPMNIFKKPLQDQAVTTAQTQKELDSLKQLGREMLNDARYAKYKEQLEAVLGKVIRDLLNYTHQNNDVYATNIRVIIQQIKDLIAILDTPITFLNYVTMSLLQTKEEDKNPYREIKNVD